MGIWGGIPLMSFSLYYLENSHRFSMAGIWGLCENVDKGM